MAAPIIARPHAVLFACGLNSVRSPMAAGLFRHMLGRTAYVGSAGVRTAELDPFAVAVMDEVGLDISKHRIRPARRAAARSSSRPTGRCATCWRRTSRSGSWFRRPEMNEATKLAAAVVNADGFR
jgi:hypothetical protein